MHEYLIFGINEKKFALDVRMIVRVVHAVQTSPVPDSPADIIGIINVGGNLVPVITLEPRLKFEILPLKIYDYFILVRDGERTIAIKANQLYGTRSVAQTDFQPALELLEGLENCVEGLLKLCDEIVLISPRKFLHLDDDKLFSQLKELEASNAD